MKRWKQKSKSWIAYLVILCLVIPAFSVVDHAMVVEAAPSENLLQNGSFEMVADNKPVSWSQSQSATNSEFGISDQEQHAGENSIYIDASAEDDHPNWRFIPLVPIDATKDYMYSAWIKVDDPNMTGTPRLVFDFYSEEGGTGNYLGGAAKDLTIEERTGGWQHLVYQMTPPAGTKSAILYLMVSWGAGKVYYDDVSFVRLDDEPQQAEGDYSIWTAPSTLTIKRDAAPLTNTTVDLEMAKREYQSGQVLLTARDGQVNITNAAISDLTSGSSTIAAADVEILVQHYVQTTTKSNGVHEPGWYPDALIPLDPYMDLHEKITVQSGNNQALWFTIKTEENTPAGVYTGTISLTANGSVEEVPITVKVRDFALPEDNHAQTAFAVWGWMLPYGYPGLEENSSEYWEIMENYYKFLLNYHVTPTNLPIPADNIADYVTAAKPYIEDPRVSAYNLPYTVGDLDNGTAKQLVDALHAEGLLDKAYYYLGSEIDEPTVAMFPKVKLRSQQIADLGYPQLRHIVTTSLHADLINDVNTFAPLFHEFEDKGYLQQAANFQAAGGNIWWYGCVIPSNPYPTYHLDDDLISARLVPWMQHAYNIEGNLYWAVNIYAKYNGTQYVTRDIWNDPQAFPNANGDGYILYPGAKYGMNSPIATLRLQAIRDGNQDYEYLWMLEDLINKAATALEVQVDAKKLIQPYHDRLFKNVKSFTKDAKELQQVRSEIADFIEELGQDPKALIVFNDLPNEQNKKEIVVYAEKGTVVSINDESVPAETLEDNNSSDRYVYMMDFNIGMNEVSIQLAKGASERTVTKYVFIASSTMEPIMKKQVLHHFSNQQSISNIVTHDGTAILGITDDHATGESKALQVRVPKTTGTESYPGIRIPIDPSLKDFSWAETIEVDIYNDGEIREMFIKVFDKNGNGSDHRMGALVPGKNHLTFAVSELRNDVANVASILFWTYRGNEEAQLYFSDLHLLGVDTEAMKQHELSFTQVIPYIDGKLNEPMWRSSIPLPYKTNATDTEASVSLHYNDDYLFVAAVVEDQHVINSGASNPWDDDSVEIYIDGTNKRGTYDDRMARYVFRVADPEVYIYRQTPKANEKVKYSYAETATGYTMEIAIPWQSLDINLIEGSVIGLTIHVNDKAIDNASAGIASKLSLTEDVSLDEVSSVNWMPKILVREKALYDLVAVNEGIVDMNGILDEAEWDMNWNIAHRAFGVLSDESSGGKLGLLWSPTHLYAAFDIKDGNIHAPKTGPVWEESSVELFVDSNFVQAGRDNGTHQYTIRVDDTEIYYNGGPNAAMTQGIVQQSKRTADGYQVEMAIPWTTIGITAEAGKNIGVTAHINIIEPGSAAALSLTGNGIADGTSTANYVAFRLSEQIVDPTEPVTPVYPAYSGNQTTTNPTTDEYVVTAQDIATKEPVIELPSDQTSTIFAVDMLAELLKNNKTLTIQQGDVQIVLSPEWIASLLQTAEEENYEQMKLELKKSTDQQGDSIISSIADRYYADVALEEELWELLVLWITDGEEQIAKPTKMPLTINLPASKEKAGNYYIYRIGIDGELMYIEEEFTNDLVSLQLLQSGQYGRLLFVKKFDDLSDVPWGVAAIRDLAARQIINGSTLTTFAPHRAITRAEFAVLLARLFELPEAVSNTFADVSDHAWYAGAVGAAAQAGLIHGQGNNQFSPTSAITREEMAVMLHRALEWESKQTMQTSNEHQFTDDASIASWAAQAIQVLVEQEMMIGRSNNQFAPKASVKRVEAAQAIYNYINKK